MERQKIEIDDFKVNPVNIFLKDWFLLTAGNMEKNNMMTIAWGSIGGMWKKPFVQVVVRPSRYTYNFLNEFETFTISRFSKEYKTDLGILGKQTGKDGDKLQYTSLNMEPAKAVKAPTYKEANLVIECRTIYSQDMDGSKFLDPEIEKNYGGRDYHRIFYGEILHIEGY